MLAKLIAALQSIDPDLTAKDIAEAIWLARYMGTRPDGDVLPPKTDGSPSLPNTPLSPPEPAPSEKSLSTPAPPSPASNLYPDAHEESGEGSQTLGALPFRSPAVEALPEALDIARALRPFMRRVPLLTQFVLNEEATAERTTEEGRWVPVLDYAQTRWLDVALVIDKSASMSIWWQTIMEFHLLLAHHGAFRDVRIWELDTNDKQSVHLYAGTGVGIPNRQPRSELELVDASQRRLILVVTDCISPAWRSGIATQTLERWGHYNPVTLVQVLPQFLWSRTALKRATPVQLRAMSPGIPNIYFEMHETNYWYKGKARPGVPLPIVTLEPQPLANWARVLARAEDAWIPGFKLATSPKEEKVAPPLSATERVERFHANASPLAYRLAGLLTTVPISLPIIRLIQRTVLPESDSVHLAEVFLGGLLKVASVHSDTLNPDYVQYDFVDGVRELLVPSVSTTDTSRVLAKMTDFLEENFGKALDFRALLKNPLATEGIFISEESRPFAQVAAKILRPLGGDYISLANWLEKAANQVPTQEQPPGFSMDGEKITSLPSEGRRGQVRGKGVGSVGRVADDGVLDDSAEMIAQDMVDSGSLKSGRVEEVVGEDSLESNEAITESVSKVIANAAEVDEGILVDRNDRSKMVHDVVKEPEDEEVMSEKPEFSETWSQTLGIVQPVKVFCSSAPEDEQLRHELDKHLTILMREGIIVTWYKHMIMPGAEPVKEIRKHLDEAEIILLLISPDYMASEYLQEVEMKRALERHNAGEALVLPILLRPTDNWQTAFFEDIQVLPHNGRPITKWLERDYAYVEVVESILNKIKELGTKPVSRTVSAKEPVALSSVKESVRPIEVYCLYAHQDEHLARVLEMHLALLKRSGFISSWKSPYSSVSPGTWEEGELTYMNNAQIILLLISPDFIASESYKSIEMMRALERHRAGEARVIPIILRPTDWQWTPFGKLPALPIGTKPVTTWQDQDEAFLYITRGIRQAIEEIRVASSSSRVEKPEEASSRPIQSFIADLSLPSIEPGGYVEIFCCYAQEDEFLQKELEKQLRSLRQQGLISEWYSRNIGMETDWMHHVDPHLNTAQIILLLISPNFMASDYTYDSAEMQWIMKRHDAGECRIIPILLRPTQWDYAPFSKLQPLPLNSRPVTSWPNRDEAFLDIAHGIRQAIISAFVREKDTAYSEAALQGRVDVNGFDVFLCYNAQDKRIVKQIGEQLKSQGILPWLDDWEMLSGLTWQHLLEEQIEKIGSVAMFIGKDGISPWQQEVLVYFQKEFLRGGIPVIPVLLADAPETLEIPIFLRNRTMVDFRKQDPDPMRYLVWGITGNRPHHEAEDTTLQGRIVAGSFDVFLCYNDNDISVVEQVGRRLKERGILPWLDEWELQPGLPWQSLVEQQIGQIPSAAMFIGKDGIGSWQREILRYFQGEWLRRMCPVIPVFLSDAPQEMQVPLFLREREAVDFRKQYPDPMEQLILGIKGGNPSVLDIKAAAIELEKQFQENDYTGSLREPPLRLIEGSIPVVLSCPHAVKHYRGGRRDPQEAEVYTGALTIQLASLTKAHALIFAHTSKEDPNYDAGGEYTSQLKELVVKSQARFVLDIHGLAQSRSTQIGVGTGYGYNLLGQEKLMDVLRNALENAGFRIDVDNRAFAASGPNTISSFTSRELGIPALQIEIHREYRDPRRKADEYARLLHALSEAIRGIVELL